MALRRKVQVLLYRKSPDGLRVLLLKRAKTEKGLWHPVTGNVEAHEGVLNAAVREVDEETGFDVAPEPLGVTFTYEQKGSRYHETAYAARVEPGATETLSEEHTAAEWVSPDEARKRLTWPDQQRALDALVARYA
jgi:8-oxo-dGTP pyrophosphatase MutT (NUDIX family)